MEKSLEEVFKTLPDIDTNSYCSRSSIPSFDFLNSFDPSSKNESTFWSDIESSSGPYTSLKAGCLKQEVIGIAADGEQVFSRNPPQTTENIRTNDLFVIPAHEFGDKTKRITIQPPAAPSCSARSTVSDGEALSETTTANSRPPRRVPRHVTTKEQHLSSNVMNSESMGVRPKENAHRVQRIAHQLLTLGQEAESDICESKSVDLNKRLKADKMSKKKTLKTCKMGGGGAHARSTNGATKKYRVSLNPGAVLKLKKYVEEHPRSRLHDPPRNDKDTLSADSGLSFTQVKNWFTNQRRRGYLAQMDVGQKKKPSSTYVETRRVCRSPPRKRSNVHTGRPSKLLKSSKIAAESQCQTPTPAGIDAERYALSAPWKLARPKEKCVKAAKQKGRMSLPSQAKLVLRSWLDRPEGRIFPKKDDIQDLSSETGLTIMQVGNWFASQRRSRMSNR